ncbi:hypothetical protein V2B08_31720, partial [Pseudomonas aeruginosa]
EWVHVQLHQQKGMISLSPPTICNSAPNDLELGVGRYHAWEDEIRARNYGSRVLAIYRNLRDL